MLKYKSLRNKLMRDAGVSAALVLGLGTAAYFLSGHLVTLEEEKLALEANIQRIASETAEMERKQGIVASSLADYQVVRKQLDEGKLTLSREKTKDILAALRKRYRISNLSLNVAPEKLVTSGEVQSRKTLDVQQSMLEMRFDAISDLHVYSFLQAMREQLPGYVTITDITMARQRLITDEALLQASKGEELRMVNVSARITWYGVATKPKEGGTSLKPLANGEAG